MNGVKYRKERCEVQLRNKTKINGLQKRYGIWYTDWKHQLKEEKNMSVTAMYVELLVVGLGGLIWATLFISWWFSDKWIGIVPSLNLENYTAVIIPFLFSAAYVLGILIDKASKGIMEGFKTEMNEDTKKYEAIIVESESATTSLNYMQSKIRIMRGYIFNWLLIGSLGWIYLKSTTHYKHLSWKVLLAGIVLAAITLGLYKYNECLCKKRVEQFCVALNNKLSRNGSPPVCQAEKPAETPKPDLPVGGQG